MVLHQKHGLLALLLLLSVAMHAQNDSLRNNDDSLLLLNYQQQLRDLDGQRRADSLNKAILEAQLLKLKTTDNIQKEDLLRQLQAISEKEKKRLADKKEHINTLRTTARGYPVLGPANDTLLMVYSKMGALTPGERASTIRQKIMQLYEDDYLIADSIKLLKTDHSYDIVYKDIIIMSLSETDALWHDQGILELATAKRDIIKNAIIKAREDNSLLKLLARIGWVALVLVIAWVIIWLIGKGYHKLMSYLENKKEDWLHDLSYKDYTFLTAEQEMTGILFVARITRWLVYILLLYITLPVIFSIFPFSRDWANALFQLIWSPFKSVLVAVWNYLPNLFSILVIGFIMRNVIRFVRYIFREIQTEKLKISGFHADWAMPTYSIIKILLYAFTFVIIFQFLPGSDSNIFKGVSVFIGILFSLGSSSAIANMVAGLVITYMRPFKIGDRIKIADISGDVIEKTLLVTRVRTIKNEVITIPNSSVLTGTTTNYTVEAQDRGLILHTTVTIGYDVSWKKVQAALVEAAGRTTGFLSTPPPFVLQTSLDDFYVAYQINAYTRQASKQALLYSALHQNIQDVFNEQGIEILSPHYRAARDGNHITLPPDYLPPDYKAPGFGLSIDKNT
ncbi:MULTISPECIES: mechanosensitive ion channel family protein [unclassified Carboxylicivirga]|uniref:mechanosensitive ion channel family protein n=1 Tax=Carboxylicivirga TaxID=1628153 RepID=UPI003D3353EB